jgi:release factor glutamine methyltransferase
VDIRSARRMGVMQIPSSSTPALDIDVILEHITGQSKSYLLAHSDEELPIEQITAFNKAVEQRQTGLPVAYITGHKEFYGIDFLVTKDVLIPKPDSELMVEHAVRWLAAHESDTKRAFCIADVCTGSGCIGLSVLHETGITANLTMTDISPESLAVARRNAQVVLNPEKFQHINFVQGDLLCAIPRTVLFDMILSNPPYIPAEEVTELLKDGRSEPRLALDGDTDTAAGTADSGDGLAIIRRLIPLAFAHLASGGIFMLETGEYNAEEAAAILKKAGFQQVITYRDLAGQLRMTTATKF